MEDKQHTPEEIEAQSIEARWGYIHLWAKAMQYWYGNPPARPSWVEYAFACYYGNDPLLWPDTWERNTGTAPAPGLIQSCALAIIDGPDVLLRITERTANNTYAEDLEPLLKEVSPPPEENKKPEEETVRLCEHYIASDDQCGLSYKYKKCPFTGDTAACDMFGTEDG